MVAFLIPVLAVSAVLFSGFHAWAEYNQNIVTAENEHEEYTRELYPDLVVLPAFDLQLESWAGQTLLRFSTTYYNQGRGPLELIADPNTAGIREDIERDVFQRIYLADGEYMDAIAGTFLWHQEHLHYHFSDFITYDLEAVDAPAHPDLEGYRTKATFCIRDVSTVEVELPNRDAEARYTICGKERQGISVGWADTYFYDYPAQTVDVTDLVSGTYEFIQRVNPEGRLLESNYNNNMSTVTFYMDKEAGEVRVLEQYPSEIPAVEHVHLDDPFGM